jgi:hypothetical protein
MTWNYRVVRNGNDLRIYDVYYDGQGRAHSRHVEPTYVHGETLEDLRSQLTEMLAALDAPILEDRDIGSCGHDAKRIDE